MRKVNWLELTTEEFAGLDPEKTIAVLPVAAIEQHGPHLAVSTDTIIGQGMVDAWDPLESTCRHASLSIL